MASQKNFAITPSVSISRSKFRRPSQHKTAFNLGDIVPIYCDADILPGDTVSLDLAALVRMSNPIAPIMDNIFVDYYAFFVPNRLVWPKWKQFMGENTTSYGAATEPSYPVIGINDYTTGLLTAPVTVGTLGDYLGLPVGLPAAGSLTDYLAVSALPGRAYCLIYNEWFRDQNLIAPVVISQSDGLDSLCNIGGSYYYYNCPLFKAAKESDYFTRALPYAQKGSPVSLPLGQFADVMVCNDTITGLAAGSTLTLKNTDPMAAGDTYGKSNINVSSGSATVGTSLASGLVVNLQNATASTINQLRFAFQYQKFLEKDALYGTRYWEILKGHFGITAPDASLQRPELLGHYRQHINIDQVLQTTGSNVSTPSLQTLGVPGANSVSGKSEHIISKSFVEHGVLMILAVARHEQTYGQGINRMWSRRTRTDFYFPVFANLGAQDIKVKEIYATGAKANDELPFGYQEAWAEYRYKPSICTNLLNPSITGSLSYWVLANNFGATPTLSQSFIEQDRTNLSRALTTGNTGPDFIADFYFDAVYVRPMPMYSLPGLIDHH